MRKTVQFITMLALLSLAFMAGLGASASDKDASLDLCTLFSFEITETETEDSTGSVTVSVKVPDLSYVVNKSAEKFMSASPVLPNENELSDIVRDIAKDAQYVEKTYTVPMIREDSEWKIDREWEDYDEFAAAFSGFMFASPQYDDRGDGKDNDEHKNEKKEPVTSCEIVSTSIRQGVSSLGDVWIDAVAVLKNTGTTNLYMESGKFDVENSKWELVDTVDYVSPYPQIIAPGETAVYHDCFTVDDGNKDENYSVSFSCDAEKAKVDLIRFPVTDVKLSEDKYGGINAVGRVENTSDKKESADISIILYDKNDQVIGVMRTSEYNIAPGAKTSFKTSTFDYYEPEYKDVARYEVYAYPDQYQW